MHPGEGVPSDEQVAANLRRLRQRIEALAELEVRARMTSHRAHEVRDLRLVRGWSAREIARHCHERWGGHWDPPALEAAGRAALAAAAEELGTQPDLPTWADPGQAQP
jgi:hypothetical protein